MFCCNVFGGLIDIYRTLDFVPGPSMFFARISSDATYLVYLLPWFFIDPKFKYFYAVLYQRIKEDQKLQKVGFFSAIRYIFHFQYESCMGNFTIPFLIRVEKRGSQIPQTQH
jgi:hypothetical protein